MMKYTKEHLDFLRKHEMMSRKELAKIFNSTFCTSASRKAIAQRCRKLGLVCPYDGRFKKGCIPANKGTKGLKGANKTSFKPGNIPSNVKVIGSISYREDKNSYTYMHIKIAEPNRWQMLHVYIWEQKHGKVPAGHCVITKDKNPLNVSLDNLMLVTRSELARLNQRYTSISPKLKETAVNVIRLQTKVKEIQKG